MYEYGYLSIYCQIHIDGAIFQCSFSVQHVSYWVCSFNIRRAIQWAKSGEYLPLDALSFKHARKIIEFHQGFNTLSTLTTLKVFKFFSTVSRHSDLSVLSADDTTLTTTDPADAVLSAAAVSSVVYNPYQRAFGYELLTIVNKAEATSQPFANMPPAVVTLLTNFVLVGRTEVQFNGLFIIKAKLDVVFLLLCLFHCYQTASNNSTFQEIRDSAITLAGNAVSKGQIDISVLHLLEQVKVTGSSSMQHVDEPEDYVQSIVAPVNTTTTTSTASTSTLSVPSIAMHRLSGVATVSSRSSASSTRKHKPGAAISKKQVDIRGSHRHVGIGRRQRSTQEFLDDGHVKDTSQVVSTDERRTIRSLVRQFRRVDSRLKTVLCHVVGVYPMFVAACEQVSESHPAYKVIRTKTDVCTFYLFLAFDYEVIILSQRRDGVFW